MQVISTLGKTFELLSYQSNQEGTSYMRLVLHIGISCWEVLKDAELPLYTFLLLFILIVETKTFNKLNR